MTKTTLSRRQWLRALGMSAAALPFVPALERHALAAGQPRRLLLGFLPMGLPRNYWPTGSETDFTFGAGSILSPLRGLEKDLIVPRNLKREWDPAVPDEHEKGIACMFTSAKLNRGADGTMNGFASGASIDQIIAKAIKPGTRFETLQIATQSDGAPAGKSETMRFMSYAGNNQPIPSENSPYKLFDKLMGAGTARPAAELEAIRLRRQSVIDLVRGELGDLGKKLGAGDKSRLDGHLESLRAVETRLQKGGDAKTCGGTKPDGTIDLRANDNFPTILKLQTDLAVQALACDATRIMTFQFGKAYSVVRHTWAGAKAEHHAQSHDESANGDVENVKILTWVTKQFAYLLNAMKAVTEPDGTTLLDNSLVAAGWECADAGSHVANPGLVLMAGKLGGRVRPGRYIDYKNNFNWSQMLVSICHVMGHTTIDKVGNIGPAGTIPGLFEI